MYGLTTQVLNAISRAIESDRVLLFVFRRSDEPRRSIWRPDEAVVPPWPTTKSKTARRMPIVEYRFFFGYSRSSREFPSSAERLGRLDISPKPRACQRSSCKYIISRYAAPLEPQSSITRSSCYTGFVNRYQNSKLSVPKRPNVDHGDRASDRSQWPRGARFSEIPAREARC